MHSYKRTYTAYTSYGGLVSTGSNNFVMKVPFFPTRQLKLDSFFWDWYAIDGVTSIVYNTNNQQKTLVTLTITDKTLNPIMNDPAALAGAGTNYPGGIFMTTPGQTILENFFNSSEIWLTLGVTNNNANSINFWGTIGANVTII